MLQQKQVRLGKGLAQRLGSSADAHVKALNETVTSGTVGHLDFLTRGADSRGRTLTHMSSNSPLATRIKLPETLA
jgi:hypothetical protein